MKDNRNPEKLGLALLEARKDYPTKPLSWIADKLAAAAKHN